MSLRITLKPGEKIFIGGAVVQNGDSPAELSILNDTALLREKDILAEEQADSACKQIYLCVQLMYIDVANITKYQQTYRRLLKEVVSMAPSTANYLAAINTDLACGRYYQALKEARRLVEYEQELIEHARQSA